MNFIEVNEYTNNSRRLINIKNIEAIYEYDKLARSKCHIGCRIHLKDGYDIFVSDKYENVLRTLNMVNEKEGQEGKVNITKINDLYVDDIESNETLDEE